MRGLDARFFHRAMTQRPVLAVRKSAEALGDRLLARADALHERVSPHIAARGLCIVCIIVGVVLVLRNLGLYPSVFADEWTYSRESRLLPLSGASIPSYLYYAIYGATNACGSAFLECARVANVVFFVLAAPFIYATCRSVATPGLSAFVAAIAVMLPLNVYTTYFMPESLYFIAFWVYAWAALRFSGMRPLSYGLLVGAMLGTASLVKVHAVFVAMAFAAYVATGSYPNSRSRVATSAAILGSAAAAFLVVRFGLGAALAGKAALDPLGSAYGRIATSTNIEVAPFPLMAVLKIATGHLMILAIVAGIPLAAFLTRHARGDWSSPADRRLADVRRFALFHLVVLVGITVYFSARVAGAGPYESTGRLHARYYNFLLPLLFMVAAAFANRGSSNRLHRIGGPWPAVAIAAVALYASFDAFSMYLPVGVDTPELTGLVAHRRALQVFGCLSAIALLAWSWRPRLGAAVFVMAVMPATMVFASASISAMGRSRVTPDVFDTAGIATRTVLGLDTSRVAIVGSGLASLYRTLFHLDAASGILIDLPPGAPLTRDQMMFPSKRWVTIIGDHPLDFPSRSVIVGDGFTVVEVLPNATIRFNEGR